MVHSGKSLQEKKSDRSPLCLAGNLHLIQYFDVNLLITVDIKIHYYLKV